MIVPVAIAGVIGLVAIRYRTLAPLGEIRFRAPWTVAIALASQLILIQVLPASTPTVIAVVLHLASYGAALAFVWVNRRWVGLLVVGLGGALNLVVIAANDGVMPASDRAIESAGLVHDDSFQNSGPVDDAALAPLGDVFAVPEPLPLANVFSVGDVIIVIGAGVLALGAYRSAARPDDGMNLAPPEVVPPEAAET
ncbi:DUF5317 family protein [Actinospongicola halichondriae]|uniref:DUF5317 family protein n=1 Tax=Actinospongicola halichondriae TaxID=3236844 RepID=UPI003D558441